MKTTELRESEKKQYKVFEVLIQQQLDDWYESKRYSVDRSQACREFDCILRGQRVEEKIRNGVKHDLLIELIQDLETNDPGWFYTSNCDFLHYIFTSNGKLIRLLRFNSKFLKQWLLTTYWLKPFGDYQVSNMGYGLTLNLVVPLADIPKELMSVYDIGIEIGRLL